MATGAAAARLVSQQLLNFPRHPWLSDCLQCHCCHSQLHLEPTFQSRCHGPAQTSVLTFPEGILTGSWDEAPVLCTPTLLALGQCIKAFTGKPRAPGRPRTTRCSPGELSLRRQQDEDPCSPHILIGNEGVWSPGVAQHSER